MMNRQPPPPGIVAAAEQDYHDMRDTLAGLVPTVRAMLAGQSEVQTLTDVWLTLLCNPTRTAALLGATAIVQLAQQPEPVPGSRPRPRPPGRDTTGDSPGVRGTCREPAR